MTIWEFGVFSWSAHKTNKGDLLIKLDFRSEENLAVWFLPLLALLPRVGGDHKCSLGSQ